MRLLFCTEVQPHAQCETVVVMQGLFYHNTQNIDTSCIQYCTNSAQPDVCFKNVHFNYHLFIELNNICQYLSVEI